jgi:hypothetical protein
MNSPDRQRRYGRQPGPQPRQPAHGGPHPRQPGGRQPPPHPPHGGAHPPPQGPPPQPRQPQPPMQRVMQSVVCPPATLSSSSAESSSSLGFDGRTKCATSSVSSTILIFMPCGGTMPRSLQTPIGSFKSRCFKSGSAHASATSSSHFISQPSSAMILPFAVNVTTES